ncbi:uncharacterized protein LOC118198180 isoform X2 [Stegodyphus dumicola]|uniref:uncharacterized protein LOC118198180 isoform X2 n=1 Tax=Stegodyphus dumicola TaxID=202533 RepID=UPI0015A93F61|nr:uncharacterized protein LOC118198180 isoform X2 [Stegodyphus dumicola]
MSEEYSEAETLYKMYPISIKKANYLVCQKIRSAENLEIGKKYKEFLKKNCSDRKVIQCAYKTLLDFFFYNGEHKEAVTLVHECIEMDIPLNKLRFSTLRMLHEYCARESTGSSNIQPFRLPAEDNSSSTSDSDV